MINPDFLFADRDLSISLNGVNEFNRVKIIANSPTNLNEVQVRVNGRPTTRTGTIKHLKADGHEKNEIIISLAHIVSGNVLLLGSRSFERVHDDALFFELMLDDLTVAKTTAADFRPTGCTCPDPATRDWESCKSALCGFRHIDLSGESLSDETFQRLGVIFAHWTNKRSHIPLSNIAFLKNILSSTKDMDRLKSNIEDALNTYSYQHPVIFTKHGVRTTSLEKDKDIHLSFIKEALDALEQIGVIPMLSYGTLLGARREGRFIPHDDDIDLLMIDESASKAEMFSKRAEHCEKLEAMGWSVKQFTQGHFKMGQGGQSIDIFPTWQDNGKLFFMRKFGEYYPIENNAMLPPSEVDLYGIALPAPNNVDLFLETRYGNDWKIPDPYQGWVWRLDRAS